MVKNRQVSKKGKSKSNNIKIQNKQSNKINKRKKRTTSSKKQFKKQLKLSLKANNRELNRQQKNEEFDNQELNDNDDEILPLDMIDNDDYLLNQNNKRKNKKDKIKAKEIDEDELENSYSIKRIKYLSNTKDGGNGNKKALLPIKTNNGGLIKQYTTIDNNDHQNGDKKRQELEQVVNEVVKEESNKTIAQIIYEKKKLIDETKERIGYLSREIIINPQEEIKKLKELRQMLNTPKINGIIYLNKLIIISLSEIFKDILPGYKIKIRQSSKAEEEEVENEGVKNGKEKGRKGGEELLSKDVKILREYEETLVKQYKLYIDYLIETFNKTLIKLKQQNQGIDKDEEEKEEDKEEESNELNYCLTILRCLCSLLDKLNYFNHRQELIEIICKQLTSKYLKINQLSFECINKLFKNDKQLELSLEIVQQMYKLLKQYSYGVKPQFINLLLSLNLKEIKLNDINEGDGDKMKKGKLTHKEKMQKLSKNERKKLKEKERLEKDLDEEKLNNKLKQLLNKQTKILEFVFLIYFNILKKKANLKLIPSVLQGLSLYSHLINLDYFDDLINLIHELINNNSTTDEHHKINLNYKSKLYCIKTIFIILNGNGKSLLIDPLRFYTCLYNLILDITLINNGNNLLKYNHDNDYNHIDDDDILLLIDCINLMFLKRSKQIPINRLLAFIKRLFLLTLQLNSIQCILILNLIKKLINLNRTSSDLLFDNEFITNVYNPYSLEPDYANASNTCLWELYQLQKHHDPIVRELSTDILKQTPISFQELKKEPKELYYELKEIQKNILFNTTNNLNKNKK